MVKTPQAQPAAPKGFRAGIIPAALVLVLLVGSLVLMSNATQDSAQFEKVYPTLFSLNLLVVLVLFVLISKNVLGVVREYRNQATGSRLTVRLVAIFVVLALVPVSVVYYFSLQFLERGIDSWFDVEVDTALQDSLRLSQSALGLRMRELVKETQSVAADLVDQPESMAVLNLNYLINESGASELTLMSLSGRIIASNATDTKNIIPNRPNESILNQLKSGRTYVGLDPVSESGLHIRAVVSVFSTNPLQEPRLLQALYPVPERINELAGNVQLAFEKYKELSYLRAPLTRSFTVTLSLILLLSVLVAIWAAFLFAQRLVAPIRVLAIGTRSVAAGNYDKRLPVLSNDDFGSLVESFNDMTENIALARDEVKGSQQQAENERAYLTAVLGSLSSGVLTLDQSQVLRTANLAANKILGMDFAKMLGARIGDAKKSYPHLAIFFSALDLHLNSKSGAWREEITLFGAGGRQVLSCRGQSFVGTGQLQAGFVVVFDDVTALIQVERDAAWGEVARRMAHEIKNPLTPIQLSAERLRHKCLDKMDEKSAKILERSTHTIIQQVSAMKEMVQAFSDYARMPKIELGPVNINDLINEVLDLYSVGESKSQIYLNLDSTLPVIEADASRLRQLIINVVKNAYETMAEPSSSRKYLSGSVPPEKIPQGPPGFPGHSIAGHSTSKANKIPVKKDAKDNAIVVNTRQVQQASRLFVELSVQDSGPGIPEEMLGRLFEPYVTSKPKGTGLGLAIVKKIVEEHGGVVWAENVGGGGAAVIIRLPVPNTVVDISENIKQAV